MDDSGYREYDFNGPPKIQSIAEGLICGLAGRFIYRPILEFLELRGDESILDFGCGGGFLIKRISNLFGSDLRITGVDTSRFYIDTARKRLKDKKNVRLFCGKLDRVLSEKESFDIITINYVLHDIKPDKRNNVLGSLVKYGKRILIHEPLRPYHGIKLEELKSLLLSNGIKEKKSKKNRSRYIGMWEK